MADFVLRICFKRRTFCPIDIGCDRVVPDVKVYATYKCKTTVFSIQKNWSGNFPANTTIRIVTCALAPFPGFDRIMFNGFDVVPFLNAYRSPNLYKTGGLPLSIIPRGTQTIYMGPSNGPVAALSQPRHATALATPPVELWLVQFTNTYTIASNLDADAATKDAYALYFFQTVFDFCAAFNAKYASKGVRIGAYLPNHVLNKPSNDVMVSLSSYATSKDASVKLGMVQGACGTSADNDGNTVFLAALAAQSAVNASCVAANTTPFTSINMDYENFTPAVIDSAGDEGCYYNVPVKATVKDVVDGFLNPVMFANLSGTGVNTVILTGPAGTNATSPNSPAYTGSNFIANGAAVPTGVTFVGSPEIYDMEGCCAKPAFTCEAAGCTIPPTDPASLTTYVSDTASIWTNGTCNCVYPAASFEVPGPNYATLPAVSFQCPDGCFPATYGLQGFLNPGVKNPGGTGCSNFSWMPLDYFVLFLSSLSTNVAQLHANSLPPNYVLKIGGYDPAFLPINWFTELGLTVNPFTPPS